MPRLRTVTRLSFLRAGLRPARLVAVAFAVQACGPSFEVIAEGDLRFAHCDRLDLDPEVASSHRLMCWREWRRVYVFGQTRDRIEYAQRRIAEIVSGAEGPPFELGGDPPGTRVHVTPAAPLPGRPPAPLEPSAPPPAVVPPLEPSAPPPAVIPSPPSGNHSRPTQHQPSASLPRDGCSVECARGFDVCKNACAPSPSGCGGCEPDYKTCMRVCFE